MISRIVPLDERERDLLTTYTRLQEILRAEPPHWARAGYAVILSLIEEAFQNDIDGWTPTDPRPQISKRLDGLHVEAGARGVACPFCASPPSDSAATG